MDAKIASIEKNKTWNVVNIPKGGNVILFKYVYNTKFSTDGSIRKHKTRLAVKGYSQQQWNFCSSDKDKNCKNSSYIVARLELKVLQLDVRSTFPNSDLKEGISRLWSQK